MTITKYAPGYYASHPEMYGMHVKEKIGTFLGSKGVKNILGVIALSVGTLLPQPAHSQDVDLMTGCSYEVDTDGQTSIYCDQDRDFERPNVLSLLDETTPLNDGNRQDILLAWYAEYLTFPNRIELLISGVIESGELPDSFYRNAQEIINDPGFDTLHFYLLGEVYRNAPYYEISTPEQQRAFDNVRDELLGHIGYLNLKIPNPKKLSFPQKSNI